MSEIVKSSEEVISKTEAAKQVKLLINLCDPDEGKPNKLIALTEEVRKELGDPPGRENVLRIASYIKYPSNKDDSQLLYQLMYIVGDQLLLKEGEQSQLDLERINSDSVYRNQQYNRIVNRIKVVGEGDNDSSLLNTCSVLMKEHDFSKTKLEFLPKSAFFRQEEPQKLEEKDVPDSSIPAPILEKDLGNKEPISDDEQAAIDVVEALLNKGSSNSEPTEKKPEKKTERVELGPSDDDEEVRPRKVRDEYKLLFEDDSEEKISYSPKELQKMAKELEQLKLDRKAGEQIDEKEIIRINSIFLQVFGLGDHGLVTQVFCGFDDIKDIDFNGQDNIYNIYKLRNKLVQLGKDSCLEGKIANKQQLADIYVEGLHILFQNNKRNPRLKSDVFWSKFEKLVTVEEEKKA